LENGSEAGNNNQRTPPVDKVREEERLWLQNYHELEAYHKQNGHIVLPLIPVDRFGTLKRWCHTQRVLKEGRALPVARIQLLDRLGFHWEWGGGGGSNPTTTEALKTDTPRPAAYKRARSNNSVSNKPQPVITQQSMVKPNRQSIRKQQPQPPPPQRPPQRQQQQQQQQPYEHHVAKKARMDPPADPPGAVTANEYPDEDHYHQQQQQQQQGTIVTPSTSSVSSQGKNGSPTPGVTMPRNNVANVTPNNRIHTNNQTRSPLMHAQVPQQQQQFQKGVTLATPQMNGSSSLMHQQQQPFHGAAGTTGMIMMMAMGGGDMSINNTAVGINLASASPSLSHVGTPHQPTSFTLNGGNINYITPQPQQQQQLLLQGQKRVSPPRNNKYAATTFPSNGTTNGMYHSPQQGSTTLGHRSSFPQQQQQQQQGFRSSSSSGNHPSQSKDNQNHRAASSSNTIIDLTHSSSAENRPQPIPTRPRPPVVDFSLGGNHSSGGGRNDDCRGRTESCDESVRLTTTSPSVWSISAPRTTKHTWKSKRQWRLVCS